MTIKREYELPEMAFVGGESQELDFFLYKSDGTQPRIDSLESKLSFMPYMSDLNSPLLTINGTSVTDEDDVYVRFNLTYGDTYNLFGKYIYQLSIKDLEENTELFQGIVTIYNNIHKDFVVVTSLS